MRISDWGSDVCSSDLSNRLSGDGHAIGRNTDGQERRRERGAAGFDGGGAADAQRGTAPSNPVAGERRQGQTSPFKQTSRGQLRPREKRHLKRHGNDGRNTERSL